MTGQQGRAEALARILTKGDFNPDHFVNRLSQEGEDDLLEMKQSLQMLADDTAQLLKKNVYKNYSQFIETAKEISILESEMYQLSHMLTEQKTIMSQMMDMSLTGESVPVEVRADHHESPEEETRRNLAFLLEKVEGCSSVAEVPGRQLIHNGDLVELDPETYSQLQRVHAFLLNDSFMIASWLPNRRGPVRYRFQGLYELDSLAVVNVRDVGPVKNAFKILMFPDTRMYQTDSAKAKRQWLDILEDTKKKKAARDKQRRESSARLSDHLKQAASPLTPDKSNPFDIDGSEEPVFMEPDLLNAEWLQELPEDLDMCIAQRDFEGSVDLVERVNDYLKECPMSPALKEFRARIDYRIKLLTEGLMSELQVSPERSLRGGPRAARRAVTQLTRLGKSAQACDLFLKNRSAIIKYNLRQLKFEGATTLYIRRLCTVFFSSLIETGREFLKAFPEHFGCFSAFVVWSKQELCAFVTIFSRQVFGSKSTLATIAECVYQARHRCAELASIGLDLGFQLDALIKSDIERVMEESRDQLMEAVKYRGGEDIWRPMNHVSKAKCNTFIENMDTAGVKNLQSLVYDDCWIALTMNVAMFSRSTLSFVSDMLKLYTPDQASLITQSVVQVFRAKCTHIEASLKSEKFLKEHEFILRNAKYILETLLQLVDGLYKGRELTMPKEIAALQQEYSRLQKVSKV